MNPVAGKIFTNLVMGCSKFALTVSPGTGRSFSAALGIAAYMLWKSERKRLADCIDRVYYRLNKKPTKDIDTIIKHCFLHFSLCIYELLKFPNLSQIKNKVKLNNIQNLKDALSKNKGVILILPHIGNWEILGAAIADADYRINSFFLGQKDDHLGNLLDNFRNYSKVKLFERAKGPRKALKSLRNGEILGMLADQDGGNHGIYTNFLGHWVSIPPGPAVWSLKTNASVVPVICLRKGLSENFEANFFPALPDENSFSHAQNVVERTKKIVNWMQKIILDNPHQYLWFYDRFRPRHQKHLATKLFGNEFPKHGQIIYDR